MTRQKDGDLVAHATGLFCEGCGKPVRRGQFVNHYDDVGEVHVNCENPWTKPEPAIAPDGVNTMPTLVLLGDPMVHYRLRDDGLGEAVQAPPARGEGAE